MDEADAPESDDGDGIDHTDVRYLEAKRTVDDRALNRRVRDRMLDALPDAPTVLEVGPGTGSTVPRLVEWGVTAGDYRGVDQSSVALDAARQRRAADLDADPLDDGFAVEDLSVRFEQGDALAALRAGEGDADLVVAQAFLDLVPLDEAFDAVEDALGAGGLLYAPITFDGVSLFQPSHPADEAVTSTFHDYIASQPGCDPRAGRHALDELRERDGTLLAAGASDWVIRPRNDGDDYPADERYFVSCVLDFVEAAVDDDPDAQDWLATRRRQLEDADLSYVAHQYDLLYRTP